MARHGALFALVLLAVAGLAEADATRAPEEAVQQVLPRPLVIELPTAEERCGEPSDEDAEMRCASWRLAGEANNLAPWTAVPEECAPHVRRYLTGPAYRSDLDLVAREASAYARAAARSGEAAATSGAAWVFDVDETLLSNLPYYAEHGYG
jgi:hypothetical protein